MLPSAGRPELASTVPYSSAQVSAPFSNEPVVDVTFSSPLKNDPLMAVPDQRFRSGTGPDAAVDHDGGIPQSADRLRPTRAGGAAGPAAQRRTERHCSFIQCSCLSTVAHGAKADKAKRKAVRLPGLRLRLRVPNLTSAQPPWTQRDAGRGSPATQHEHSQQRTTNILLVIGRTPQLSRSVSSHGFQLSAGSGR
jgi:hypothetical protein